MYFMTPINAEKQQTNLNMVIKPEIVANFRFSCSKNIVANITTELRTLYDLGGAVGIFIARQHTDARY